MEAVGTSLLPLLGEEFTIPVVIEIPDATAVASYALGLQWDVTEVAVLGATQGDFSSTNGTFDADVGQLANGALGVQATQPTGVGPGVFELFTLNVIIDESVAVGGFVVITIDVTTLQGPGGENLLPALGGSPATTPAAVAAPAIPGLICVSVNAIGDLTADGKVQSGDAVQILRYLVGDGDASVDITRADVTGDGKIDLGDAVTLLRNSAELDIPETSKLGKSPVVACPAEN